jgi:membrane protein DedA with SNARE-associated domain/membrane-associated phospholipid phosphatase
MLRDWILAIPYLNSVGYLFAFFGAFLETLPAIGLFVPGQTAVVAAGFLAEQGVLNLPAVFILASLGAIAGDFLGYWLGRKYGVGLFAKQQGIISDMIKLLQEHPFKTLLFGRFHGLTRAFAPFAAGASKVRLKRFLPANIIGGIAWGGFSVAIGYIIGKGYELAAQTMDHVLLIAGIVVSVMLLVYYYLRKLNVLNRYTRRLLFVNIGSLILFAAVLRGMIKQGLVVALDTLVQQSIPVLRMAPLTALMVMLTPFYHLLIISILTAGTVLVLWRHNRRATVLFAVAVIGAVIIERTFKVLLMRLRPSDALVVVDTYAFPSGHAVISAVFFGGLILAMTPYVNRKKLFIASCMIAVFLISFSRIYLGVHWFSDVVGGVLLGVFWLTFVFLGDELVRSYSADQKRKLSGEPAVQKKE